MFTIAIAIVAFLVLACLSLFVLVLLSIFVAGIMRTFGQLGEDSGEFPSPDVMEQRGREYRQSKEYKDYLESHKK